MLCVICCVFCGLYVFVVRDSCVVFFVSCCVGVLCVVMYVLCCVLC